MRNGGNGRVQLIGRHDRLLGFSWPDNSGHFLLGGGRRTTHVIPRPPHRSLAARFPAPAATGWDDFLSRSPPRGITRLAPIHYSTGSAGADRLFLKGHFARQGLADQIVQRDRTVEGRRLE